MTDAELNTVLAAIKDFAENFPTYAQDYHYDANKNEFFHKAGELAALDLEVGFRL